MSEILETKNEIKLAPLPEGTAWFSPFLTVKKENDFYSMRKVEKRFLSYLS